MATSRSDKRAKQVPAATGVPALLSSVPAHDPFAGTKSLKSGRGKKLKPPSAAALAKAKELLQLADSSTPTELDLPTGAGWPALPVVTPDGLQTHFVAPLAEAGVDVRDPNRLTMSKRGRAGEE